VDNESSPAPPFALAVDVKGVYKQFRQGGDCIDALKDVSLQAYTQELLMIVGPSGCGKTTLLSVIAGTLLFDQGEIDLFGLPLHRSNEKEITRFRRENIGFIFQQYNLIHTLTCLENVTIPLLLNDTSPAEAEHRAVTALEKVGLKGREKDDPRKLSGGQQQRVAIARALVHEPRLVICDEPTAALDSDTGLKVMDLMKEITTISDRCMIVVTHDNRIFKYADRVVEMDDGRVMDISVNHNS
jgi:putative ABC transport system ATP-binding protein